MPAGTALSRVSKSEFFAILGPGLYAVGSAGLLVIAYHKPAAASVGLSWAAGLMEKHWSVAAGVLFLAYLAGNVLRTPRVNNADRHCDKFRSAFAPVRRLFTRLIKSLRRGRLRSVPSPTKRPPSAPVPHGTEFPYLEMLKRLLDHLKPIGLPAQVSTLEADRALTMFNFWKAMLCHKSERGYESALDQEARIRLFVNMYRGAAFALPLNLIGFVLRACLGNGRNLL